jgi:apolipoprotein N-acyltransferase
MIRLYDRMARLKGWRRVSLACLAGALAAFALPPFGFWPALVIAFPVFIILLESQPADRWRSGFGPGWMFGLGYFVVAFHWIGFAFLIDAATYLWMMPFMVGALAGGMAIYWGLAAVVARRIGRSGLPLVLAFAACLGIFEWLRGHLLTGFPWAAPGLSADGMGAVAQLAAYVGMPGLTILLVMWAGLPAAFMRNLGKQSAFALVLLALLPAAWAIGFWRLPKDASPIVPGVELRIVQPNIGQDQKWREDNSRSIFDTLKRLSTEPSEARPNGIAGVTLLLWPESAVPFLIDESLVAKDELRPLLGGRTALITGSLRRELLPDETRAFNSIIVFDSRAEVAGRYDKWRLVPGGEFLPFAPLLEPLGFRKVVTVPGSFNSGPGPRTLSVPGTPDAAMLICYEAIFPHDLIDPSHRPGYIVNVTNDGWFGQSTGPYQHLAQVRMRAIEQGLPMLRAANTGISSVIDSYGRSVKSLPLMEQGVIDSSLPQAIAAPVYAKWGDWTGATLAILLLALSLFLQPPGNKAGS